MRAKDPKLALLQWVDEQYQLDPRSKFILHKLALYCDANGQGWAKVEDLARGTNSSVRTVQSVLKTFRTDGLIRPSGDEHTLNPGSRYPRKVPIYQLACGVEGIDPEALASGAEIAPEPALGCKSDAAGVQLVAPRKEPKGTYSPSDEGETHAPERDALFVRLEAAYPKRGLGFTNRSKARQAFDGLVDQGIDVELLIQAAANWAADGRGKRAETALEYWLIDGRYRGFWPEPQQALEREATAARPAEQPGAAPAVEQTLWDEVLRAMVYRMTENEFGSWLSRAWLGEHAGQLYVVAFSATAKQWLLERRRRQIEEAWAEADPKRRPLKIVSKGEFEALRQRQSEGVD